MFKETEKAFQNTSKIVLGTELSGIEKYAEWLERHVKGKIEGKKSKISDETVYVPAVDFYKLLGDNIVTMGEALTLGEKKLSEEMLDKLTLENASETLNGIKTTTPEVVFFENAGITESSNYGPCQYCHKIRFTWFSKYVAHSFWVRDSEHMFGCSNVAAKSSFCIKCYSSTKITRCFEVNDSYDCSDCYFCHNCEGLRDCMFCFNTKAKRYAIGNVEVGRERYLELKEKILKEITKELLETGGLRYDIYNISSVAKK